MRHFRTGGPIFQQPLYWRLPTAYLDNSPWRLPVLPVTIVLPVWKYYYRDMSSFLEECHSAVRCTLYNKTLHIKIVKEAVQLSVWPSTGWHSPLSRAEHRSVWTGLPSQKKSPRRHTELFSRWWQQSSMKRVLDTSSICMANQSSL